VKPTLKKSVFLLAEMEKIKIILSHHRVIFGKAYISPVRRGRLRGRRGDDRQQRSLRSHRGQPAAHRHIEPQDATVNGADITRRIKRTYPLVMVILITEEGQPGMDFGPW
jgi:hypothetical protein